MINCRGTKVLACALFAGAVAFFLPGRARCDAAGAETASVDRVQLPRDDGAHDSLIEWWYWTGHLRAASGRRFGFELVFFELRPFGITCQVTHHAITDIQDGSFHFRIERDLKEKTVSVQGIDLSHAGLWAKGRDGRDSLHGQVDEYQLDLTLISRKAPVLQHDRGYIDYDFGGHTYYYSRERLDARGKLRIADQELQVTGGAWFDHQWGNMGEVFEQSWDWFGIQLDGDREYMVYRMRVGGREKLRGGSYSPPQGQAIRLRPGEIEITPRGEWKSPHSGCTYPRQWLLKIRDQELLLVPLIEDQELWSSVPRYWEGTAEVSGTATGTAFIELNNYCR